MQGAFGSANAAGPSNDQGQKPPPDLPPGPWTLEQIETASHDAVEFVQLFFESFDDLAKRQTDFQGLFIPEASMVWNGNTLPLSDIPGFMSAFPPTSHEIQTVDSHPLQPDETNPNITPFPDLTITITGSVISGPAAIDPPNMFNTRTPAQDLPRRFYTSFLIRAIREATHGSQSKYAICTCNYRFVG